MSAKIIHTKVEGRNLKLTNLDKVIYPNALITKAEIIQYYMQIAPTMLQYIANRPLTFIRFPDGINKKGFYSKDKPEWTPDWISSYEIEHEDKTIDYILAKAKPSLVWMANLACLELHPMQFIADGNTCPDHFIFDLDPDESLNFDLIKECANQLRDILIKKDYSPLVKTSGGKGLHVIVPIHPKWTFDEVKECAKSIAQELIKKYPTLYTLNISKDKRKGKILLDIYRNHLSNTTVAPYSLRGRKGAPVSMPLKWEELGALKSANQFTIKNVMDHLEAYGDPWANWRAHSADLHTQKLQSFINNNEVDSRLEKYIFKRNLDATPEPLPRVLLDFNNQFVVQLHNATNLHYDLRLEDNGVLLSWAIPKCLPFKLGQKRLAIRTEDHPIEYLVFEGEIPKGEYGAGQMHILDNGQIDWIEKKENKYLFRLKGEQIQNQYKLYKIKGDNQWIVECTTDSDYVGLGDRCKPMLANAAIDIPKGDNIKYEVKWDGIRALIYIEGDKVEIVSRNGNMLTQQFPELIDSKFYEVEQGVFDMEIVVLDDEGRPNFSDVISRMHTGTASIAQLQKRKPAVAYIFDLLSLDGIDTTAISLYRRRKLLSELIKWNNTLRFSESFENGEMLFSAIEKKGMEGIMAKDQTSAYEVDTRSNSWLKVKCRKMDQCLIIGYTLGKGERAGLFGALHLAKSEDGKLVYMGKVGTGFDAKKLASLMTHLKGIPVSEKMVEDKIEEEKNTRWIKPELICKIQYASLTNNKTYREPVFIELRS